jgi:F-type H+-transporting ATPase subunit delta
MLELVRGYAAAVLDAAEAEGVLSEVVVGLAGLRRLVVASDPLRLAITDGSIPNWARGAVVSDLLEPKVRREVVALATFPVVYERASEIPKSYEQLLELAEQREQRSAVESEVVSEPPIGRSGALERLRGYSERVFERIDEQESIDAIEDELFRFARVAEQYLELRAALSSPQTPVADRIAIVDGLLTGKVRDETIELVFYVLRCGRARDLVGAVDYLVELAAAERGRRVADVRAAIELDQDERDRLATALRQRVRRNVELRVVIDPSVLGGIGVTVGDTVIDGTLRHRLDQLRDVLLLATT